ncbi:MAG: hypothetical protein RJB56_1155 [Actinomycetota bacterium]|jgi:Transmembrane domain of unknown function (DUF3566)
MKERIKAAGKAAQRAAARAAGPAPKQVKLKLVQIDFWSATRVGFLITVALGIATIVGFSLLWLVLSQTGLFGSLSELVNSVIGGGGGDGVNVASELNLARVLSFATTIAFFNIVLGTALTGVSALIFNLIGRITGGISVGFTNN